MFRGRLAGTPSIRFDRWQEQSATETTTATQSLESVSRRARPTCPASYLRFKRGHHLLKTQRAGGRRSPVPAGTSEKAPTVIPPVQVACDSPRPSPSHRPCRPSRGIRQNPDGSQPKAAFPASPARATYWSLLNTRSFGGITRRQKSKPDSIRYDFIFVDLQCRHNSVVARSNWFQTKPVADRYVFFNDPSGTNCVIRVFIAMRGLPVS